MEETVGSHKPSPNRPNQPEPGINKCFLVMANLLTEGAPIDVKRHQEYIVLRADKTFSLFQERLTVDPDGRIDHFRVMDSKRYYIIGMLCYDNGINPKTIFSLN